MIVFAHTNKHNGSPYYFGSAPCEPIEPTDDTLELIGLAVQGVNRLWREVFATPSGGVILPDLVKKDSRQRSLFDLSDTEQEKRARLMAAVDNINRNMGRGTVFPAAAGIKRAWKLKAEMKSPCLTVAIWEG